MSGVFDIDCPECGIKCWFDNGDTNDLSVMDVEAVQCWHCHSQFKVNEDDEENISEKLIRDTFQTASQAIDQQTQPGLLPCPFCGSEDVGCYSVSSGNGWSTSIECRGCEMIFRHRYGKHQEAWNTRANKTQ